MSWTTAVEELRILLSDGAQDKLRHRKRVFGTLNGMNVTFKTLEFRRVTDFMTASTPEGVFVDGVTAAVATDNPVIGEFTLIDAPLDGQVVEATYYIQWFTDDELKSFLLTAAQWLQFDLSEQIPPGLRPSALHYCAQEAYMKLSLRWAEKLSETYRLEDAQDENNYSIVNQYKSAAMDMHKKSMALRDDFYRRSGKSLQPSFASIPGRLRDPVPRR